MQLISSFSGRLRVGLFSALMIWQASAKTTNLAAVADTTLHIGIPNNNFGGGISFHSGGGGQEGNGKPSRALLRFNIASYLPSGSTINSAQLTLTVIRANGPNSTFNLHRVLAEWGEGSGYDFYIGSPAAAGDATWHHRQFPSNAWMTVGGDYHATVSGSQFVAGLGSYTFSGQGMKADAQMWLDNPESNFGWLLRSQAETYGTRRRFASRMGEVTFPQLVIDYTTPTAAVAELPNLFEVTVVDDRIQFSFNAQSNRTYAVEFRDTLSVTNWSVLTNIPALPQDAMVHITNGISGSERYFRARTP